MLGRDCVSQEDRHAAACTLRPDCYFEHVTAWERYIGKHKAAIRLAMARGDLPYEATDKALYIDPADLRRLIAEGKLPSIKQPKSQ
jgi:hypothetical protein